MISPRMLGLLQIQRPAPPAAKPTARRRPWPREAMHWVRRVHLFSGLFMFPWVLLYGSTALLFNHPGAFPDQARRVLEVGDFTGTALERVADPAADAEQVMAALNKKFAADDSRPRFRLVEPEKARYARDRITARVRGDGQEHAVQLDLPSGAAVVSTTQQAAANRAPFATRGLKVAGSLGERVKTSLPTALQQLGLAADEAGIAVGADLVFIAEADGRRWKANYSIQTGAVTGSPADAPSNRSFRAFLTQLHLTHGYPSSGSLRWAWAVGVDAMFASMLFWGCSGLLMWWQIKAIRNWGAIVLCAGLATATLLALLLHPLLTA